MIFTYFLLLSELPFTFLMLSCEAQKLLFVMRPNVSTFFFVACFSCVISKNSMLNARSWRFPLMFSLRIYSFSSYIIFLLHFVLFMFMMKGLISFFCMQLFSFLYTIYWTGCLLSIVYFCSCVRLIDHMC